MDIKEKNLRELAKILSIERYRDTDIEKIEFSNRCKVLANNLVKDFNDIFENYLNKIDSNNRDHSLNKLD